MSRVKITALAESRIVVVGKTLTVTLSEREAAVLAYLLGRVPLSLLDHNTTLYDSLVAVIGDSTADWEGPSNILPRLVDADKIRERLEAYSNRHE